MSNYHVNFAPLPIFIFRNCAKDAKKEHMFSSNRCVSSLINYDNNFVIATDTVHYYRSVPELQPTILRRELKCSSAQQRRLAKVCEKLDAFVISSRFHFQRRPTSCISWWWCWQTDCCYLSLLQCWWYAYLDQNCRCVKNVTVAALEANFVCQCRCALSVDEL